MGRVRMMVRRKNRRRIFQNDSTPVTKVNFVKKAEMKSVNRRTTMVGHINLKLLVRIFFIEMAAMASLSRFVFLS
jgi:hypothetical protein